jgi:hypothetical protein
MRLTIPEIAEQIFKVLLTRADIAAARKTLCSFSVA